MASPGALNKAVGPINMTITDGLEVFGGILTTLGILFVAVFVTTPVVVVTGSKWGLAIPFLVLAAIGILAARKRRDAPSPYLNGLIIGACISMLVCCTCDIAFHLSF